MSEISLSSKLNYLRIKQKNIIIFISLIIALSLGLLFIFNEVLALVLFLFLVALVIALTKPSLLIIFYFIYLPFTEYFRYLFPSQIDIGGYKFILSGSVKELLFLLILSSFIYRKFTFNKEDKKKSILFHVILIFLCWLFIFIFRNGNPETGFWGFRTYLYTLGFYFIGYYFIEKKVEILRIIKVFLFSGFVLTIVGILQIFFDPNFLVTPEEMIDKSREIYGTLRITSLLSNPNALGIFLVIIILSSCVLFVYSKSNIEKTYLIILPLSASLVVFYTYSRESWIALIVGILILSFFYLNKRRFVPIVVFITCFVIITSCLPHSIYEHFFSIGLSGGRSRIIMWKSILDSIGNNFILGSGTGSIGSFGAYGMNVIIFNNTGYSVTDNAFLKILVESGIVGLVLLFIICVLIGKHIILNLKVINDENFREIAVIVLLMFSTLLITSLFSDSLFSWLISPLFFLMVGYVSKHGQR